MSTSYYRLKPPITSIRIDDLGNHDRINVWVSHGLSGSLTVSKDETPQILFMFAEIELDETKCITATWSKLFGTIINNDKGLSDTDCVISEYGKLHTIGEIRGN